MARTPSTMVALGTAAPPFALRDVVSREAISLATFAGKQALLVMFICNHCPYVKHVEQELARLGHDCAGQSVGLVAISANDADTVTDDSPDCLRDQARRCGFAFPYCHDETQAVARAYGAACTPDFFLFDDQRRLVYRGQLDSSRPGNGVPVTGGDLRAALDALLGGRPVAVDQKPSLGCNIKWRT